MGNVAATVIGESKELASAVVDKLPDEFFSIISDAVEKFPDDIAAANELARSQVWSMDSIAEIQRLLVNRAILDAIYARRHTCNSLLSRQVHRGGDSSRRQDFSAANGAAAESILDYLIGGQRIGSATKETLLELRDALKGHAIGVVRDMLFCESLLGVIKPNKTVSQSIKEAEAVRMFREAATKAARVIESSTKRPVRKAS